MSLNDDERAMDVFNALECKKRKRIANHTMIAADKRNIAVRSHLTRSWPCFPMRDRARALAVAKLSNALTNQAALVGKDKDICGNERVDDGVFSQCKVVKGLAQRDHENVLMLNENSSDCDKQLSDVRNEKACMSANYVSVVAQFATFLRQSIETQCFDYVRTMVRACGKDFFIDVMHALDLTQLVRDGFFTAIGVLYVRSRAFITSNDVMWHNAADAMQFSSMHDLLTVASDSVTQDFACFLIETKPYDWFVPPKAAANDIATSFVLLVCAIVGNTDVNSTTQEDPTYEAMRFVTELIEPQAPRARVEILRLCVQISGQMAPILMCFFESKLAYQESVEITGQRLSQHRLAPIKRSRFL
jgi:hypothetical protein